MKTNPWLLALDLFESEAVPAKQSLSNIQHLWQQVRIAHIACVLLNQNSRKNQHTIKHQQQKHQSLKQIKLADFKTTQHKISPYLSSQIDYKKR